MKKLMSFWMILKDNSLASHFLNLFPGAGKGNLSLREAFKRKNRKYIGLLPIGGTPPPIARIGKFPVFSWAISLGHNWAKNCINFLHVSEHIDHFKEIYVFFP